MKKYRVGVTCLIEDFILVDVEADTLEEAYEKAQAKAEAEWDVLKTETQFVVDTAVEVLQP